MSIQDAGDVRRRAELQAAILRADDVLNAVRTIRAGEAARRVDALEAENLRLRTAIDNALLAAANPDRTSAECLCAVHAILCRAAADLTADANPEPLRR